MKKIFFVFTLFCLCVLTSCTGKEFNPYQGYHRKTSIELFKSGEMALARRNYLDAVKNFEALCANYPFDFNTQKAQLDLIYAYYKSGDVASVILSANNYIRLYPRSYHVDYAYYMRGIAGCELAELSWVQKLAGVNPASHDMSTLKDSYKAFTSIVNMFPKSHYAADALKRMKYICSLMAQHEIMIAQFYLRRHAYVAAANRATYVVQHYQGLPEVLEGLAIMIQSYQALGLPNMVKSSYRLLKVNYLNLLEIQGLSN